ncbi:Zinc finger protein 830 [Merluccius polli]|uniref:Zinc finger protein 830 n=1 Tax=Merluccius polli TaxID=89951 RepID=A0AA47M1Z4_MERPO|nr:Zinc finger protein 830 [Merluccius polli]
MPPAKKAKKVIHQDELRRLMREKQRQSTDKKKVESPYAKYNSLGHLSCALCNAHVKSELLWQTHVLGKQHREKVAEVKASAHTPPPQHLPLKRKTPEPEDGRGKAAKSSRGDSDLFKKPSARLTPPTQKKSAGLSLLAGVYDDDDEEDEDDDEGDGEERGKTGAEDEAGDLGAPAAGLPDDFFDSAIPAAPAVSHSGSVLKADAAAAERSGGPRRGNAANASAEALPEGFFDDPVRDAKVRNVEAPQDLMDKEWDEFQREIRQVNTKSDAIVAEDDEEGRIGRQIGEIDEQIACYRRVEVLRDRREVARRGSVRDGGREEDGEEDEEEVNDTNIEEDEEELLGLLSRDWRAKGALA